MVSLVIHSFLVYVVSRMNLFDLLSMLVRKDTTGVPNQKKIFLSLFSLFQETRYEYSKIVKRN